MKLAILFTGRINDNKDQYENIMKNLVNNQEVDFFISYPKDTNKDMVQKVSQLYNPKIIIENNEEYFNVDKYQKKVETNKHNVLSMFLSRLNIKNAFTSSIDEETVTKIMLLNDVESIWKILLLMGIGVFTTHTSIDYSEIMKKLADQQKLYMIIASSDYIYGTNYQFCHGYLSKDMVLTQEKIIQSMGRIGRNNIQQNYSIRFRDDSQIIKLFTPELNKIEVKNMNILFFQSTSTF
jgi:hypothetical protein